MTRADKEVRQIDEGSFDSKLHFDYHPLTLKNNTLPIYRCAPPPYSEKDSTTSAPASSSEAPIYEVFYDSEKVITSVKRPNGSFAANVKHKLLREITMTAADKGSVEENIEFQIKKHAYTFKTTNGDYAWVQQPKANGKTLILIKDADSSRGGVAGGSVAARLEILGEKNSLVKIDLNSNDVDEVVVIGSILAYLKHLDAEIGSGGKGIMLGYAAFDLASGGALIIGGLASILT